MRLNRPIQARTHEGAPAKSISAYQELRRAVLACMLWERQFYENGESIADRISKLAKQCNPEEVASLAVQARTDYKLRHAPMLLTRELARHPKAHGRIVGDTLYSVIQRADELAEFVAIYWQDGKQPLSKQVKMGLARAFRKFDEYQLAKYDRPGAVRLRDVLFLSHARPKDDEQAALWKRLVDGTLETPDTWETSLSAGTDKRETFTRLIKERKLGYMALLRNLRNMQQAGVSEQLVAEALLSGAAKSKALPFRFIAAARAVPGWEPMIDEAMKRAMTGIDRLHGKTVLLVDVSYSMVDTPISKKSDMDRLDAAAALAALIAGISAETPRIFVFSNYVAEVPPRQGMALIDAIRNSEHGGTYLGGAVKAVESHVPEMDRLIVLTDEQSHDRVPDPKERGYMINVASYQNGVGYGKWLHIDGFSEAVVNYIQAMESEKLIA